MSEPRQLQATVTRHFIGLSAMAHPFAALLHIPEVAGHHARGFAPGGENLPV